MSYQKQIRLRGVPGRPLGPAPGPPKGTEVELPGPRTGEVLPGGGGGAALGEVAGERLLRRPGLVSVSAYVVSSQERDEVKARPRNATKSPILCTYVNKEGGL